MLPLKGGVAMKKGCKNGGRRIKARGEVSYCDTDFNWRTIPFA